MILKKSLIIAIQEFKIRDQGSFLGFFWTLLNPIILFATLYTIFSGNSNEQKHLYAFYLMAGVLFWNFFSNCTMAGLHSVANRSQYTHGTNIPISALLTSSILIQLMITFFESLVCFLAISLIFGGSLTYLVNFYIGIFWVLPIAVTSALILMWIRRLLLDTTRLWELALRIGFFITPIFYYAHDKPLYHWLKLNPLYVPLEISRYGIGKIDHFAAALFICWAICSFLLFSYTQKNSSKIIEVG